jgi:hypothetical protein
VTEPTPEELFAEQRRLQSEAASVIKDLKLLDLLDLAGVPRLVGSLATGLMVWRDIDCTVSCERLDISTVMTIASRLLEHPKVVGLDVRKDTGDWNRDPATYPDGLLLEVDYRSDESWELDIWFIDEPERQPDLGHVDWLRERLTDESRATILDLKRRMYGKPSYSSYRIYEAVLEHGVETLAEYEAAAPQLPPDGVID